MECHEHALSGAVAFAAAAPLLHPGPAALAAGVVFTAGAALLPDIDEPGSRIARESGFVTTTLARMVHRIAGGHRKGTHSVAGIAVFTASAWAATIAPWHLHDWRAHLAALVILGLFVQLLLAAALHALRLGAHHGDLIASVAAGLAVWRHWGLALVPLCIALGALAHVAGDELTHSGCPLLYPFSGRDYHLLPEPLRFTTGKWAERYLISPLLLAALGFLLWRDVAAVHLTA